MEAIPLTSLLPDGFDPTQYKVHFAVWNQIKHPIDVLATSWEEWHGWNSWRSANNDFNRDFMDGAEALLRCDQISSNTGSALT